MGALVGVDRLQVHDVADHVVLVRHPVAAVHVAGGAGDIQGLAAGVALGQRDRFRRGAALVHQPAQAQASLQADGDLGLHVGQLLLDQLVGGQGPAELLALQGVVARRMPAELGGTERAPGDAVAGPVEAAEGPLEALHVGQQVLLRDLDVVHDDLAGDRGPQRELAFDLGRREALHALFQDEAADFVLGLGLGPDHEDVGDGRVGDPHLGALEEVAAVDLAGPGLHAAGIRAVVRLGQAEAADQLAGRQARQVLAALRLAAIGVDGVHDQAGLDAHGRAVAAVDPLDFARHQAVADVVDPGAAVVLGQGRAQEAQRAHLGHDLPVEALVAVGLEHPGHQLLLAVGPGGVADEVLVLAQLLVQQQRVLPGEAGARGGGGGTRVLQGHRLGRGHRAVLIAFLVSP